MGKRGPKPGSRPPSAAFGASVNVRLSPYLKARIEAAADHSGRKPAEEIRARLENSFGAVSFEDPETKILAVAIGVALAIDKDQTGFKWFRHPWAWARANAAIEAVLSLLRPTGDCGVVPADARLLRDLRSSGVPSSVVDLAADELRDVALGELSGKAAVALLERIADGGTPSESWETLAAGVTKMLRDFDTDTVALSDLQSASDALGSDFLDRFAERLKAGPSEEKHDEQ